jgi:hypothetical protein
MGWGGGGRRKGEKGKVEGGWKIEKGKKVEERRGNED